MPVPDDTDDVLTAIRLGWCVAEVRGRNRPDAPLGGPVTALPSCEGHALPLQSERSAAELLVQTYAVLMFLADKVGVDANPADGSSFSREVAGQAAALVDLRASGSVDALGVWEKLAELIYMFDAHIQDCLAAKSPNELAGYQLGRGLAECYWALDPAAPDPASPAAWGFLLGAKRVQELSRLLGSLSAYFPSYNAPAIAGTLQVWRDVAADEDWRDNAHDRLYMQVRRWYQLTVLRQDPARLIVPKKLRLSPRVVSRIFRVYYSRILMGLVGVAAGVALIRRIGTGEAIKWVSTEGPNLWKALLAILAVTGLTTIGFSTPQIVRRIIEDQNIDLIAIAISTCPPPPQRRR
jgi:hypothetical protein